MAEDTAVLEAPDTVAEQVAPDFVPETVAEPAAETGSAEATETVEPTPDPEPPANRFAGKSDEEIEKALEWERAKVREAERQSLQTQMRREQQQRDQEDSYLYLSQGAYDDFGSIIKAVEEGQEYDPQAVYTIAQRVAASVQSQTARVTRDKAIAAIQKVAPGGRIPPAVVAYINDAVMSGDIGAAMEAVVTVSAQANTVAMTPKMKAEAELSLRKQMEDQKKTQQIKDAQANRPDGPTAGLPAAGTNGSLTLAALQAMSTDQVQALRQKPGGKEAIDRALSRGR